MDADTASASPPEGALGRVRAVLLLIVLMVVGAHGLLELHAEIDHLRKRLGPVIPDCSYYRAVGPDLEGHPVIVLLTDGEGLERDQKAFGGQIELSPVAVLDRSYPPDPGLLELLEQGTPVLCNLSSPEARGLVEQAFEAVARSRSFELQRHAYPPHLVVYLREGD